MLQRALAKLRVMVIRRKRPKDPSVQLLQACSESLVRHIVRRVNAQEASDRLARAKYQYASELHDALLVAAEAKKALDDADVLESRRLVRQAKKLRRNVGVLHRRVEALESAALAKAEERTRSGTHYARTIGQISELRAFEARINIEQQALLIERKTEWLSRISGQLDRAAETTSTQE